MQYDRITVEMIEQKEFKQKVRGYDPDEVDAFLDSICDEMIALQDEIDALNLKLSQQKPAMAAPVAMPVAPPPTPAVVQEMPRVQSKASDQDAAKFKEILETAKQVSDQTIAQAEEKAEAIVAKAQKEADKQLGSLEKQHEELTERIEMLKLAAKDYRDRFNQLVEDQKYILTAQNELFK